MKTRELKRKGKKLEAKHNLLLRKHVSSYFAALAAEKLDPKSKRAMDIFHEFNQKWQRYCEQNNPKWLISPGKPYYELDGFAFVKNLEAITKQMVEQQKKGKPVARKSK